MPEEPWRRSVERALGELSRRGLRVEAAIVFGSWARSGGGDWSDVDVLVVTDDVKDIPVLDRFAISAGLRVYGVDLFLYTFEELKTMAARGNPLALSALAEGLPVVVSERVGELAQETRRMCVKKGVAWIRRDKDLQVRTT